MMCPAAGIVLIAMSAQIGPPDSISWTKVSDSTRYSPRDSSPNACVVHNDAVWVLGGYRRENDTTWHSVSDVWRSADGVTWDLINPAPPYSPYSAFVSFNGAIWAIGQESYKSDDGNVWEPVETNIAFGYSYRAVVFRGEIWLTNGTSIYKSPNGYDWEVVLENAPWDYRAWPGFVVFHDKLWFFGGGINYLTGSDYYFNDIWSSKDGKNWTLETPNATWPGRYWFGYQVYDDKMWIIGGWDYYETENETYGNRNDTWYSENGVDWFRLPTNSTWPERHAPLTWVFKGSMWVSSGYGSLGVSTLYNDVWMLTNTWKNDRIEQTIYTPDTITYGMPSPLYPELSSGLRAEFAVEEVEIPNTTLEKFDPNRIPPGSYTIRYLHPGNSIFAPMDETRTLVVSKKDVIVTVPDYHKFFGWPDPTFDLQFEGFVFDDDETVIEEIPVAYSNADRYSPEGEYDIMIEGGYSSLYNFVYRPGKMQIRSAGLDMIYFPNPVRERLTVYLSREGTYRVQLISPTGQIVFSTTTAETAFELDMAENPAGLYLLRILAGSQSRIERIVKL